MWHSKKSNWAKGVYASLLVLAVTASIGVVFFPQGARDIAKSVGETIFLPIVSKPTIYESDNTNIHWEKDTAPYSLAYAQAVTVTTPYNEYMYLIGGGGVKLSSDSDPIIEQSPRVMYAPLNADGTLGDWEEADDLPIKLHGASATAVDGLIYVLGGLYFSPGEAIPKFSNKAYCAKINPDGTFDTYEWKHQTNNWDLFSNWESGVAYHATIVINDRIYIIGGFRRKAYFNQTWHLTRFVLSAKLNLDGECQDLNWEVNPIEDNSLPRLMNHTAVGIEISETDQTNQTKDYIYVMGGEVWEPCDSGDACQDRAITKRLSAAVFRAEIGGESGVSVGPWENLGDFTMGGGLHLMTAVRTGDYLYVLGGTGVRDPDSAPATGCIYRTKLLDDGGIGPWEQLNVEGCELTLYGHAATVSSFGRIYVIGGARAVPVVPEGEKDPTIIPEVSDTIYWTPLAFLSKVSNPGGTVYPGDQVTYNLTTTSNNVRDLPDVAIIDMLPANLQLVSAPRFSYDEPILTSENFELPINHLAQFTISAVVSPLETPTPNGASPGTTPVPNLQTTPTPETTTQLVESNIRPTQVKGCVTETDDNVIFSGTPRPKPTCTPTPTLTMTATVTPTYTDTPTPTPTDTPTVETPSPEPVYVVNEAFLCLGLGSGQQWCKMATAVNAPYRTYLPLVTK